MKALFLTLLTTGLLQISNLGSGMLAAHILAPEGRGQLAAAILWPSTLAYLVLFGLNDAVLYYVASRRETSRDAFGGSLVLGGVLAVAAMILGYFVVIPLAYAEYPPEVRQLATVLLLMIPLNIFGTVYMELLRGNLRVGLWNALRVANGVFYVLFILICLGLGRRDVEAFGIAYLASQIPTAAIAFGAGLVAGWWAWTAPRQTFRNLLTYGAKIHASTVVTMLNSRIDQMLIAATLDAASLGLYVVATTLSQVTATLANSVTLIAYPRACAEETAEGRTETIGLYLRATLVLMIFSTLVLGLLAPLLLRILFGAGFTAASSVVQIMVLGVIPLAIKDFFALAFKAFDRPLTISKGEILTLAVNAALLGLLVPPFGLTGAAIAFVIVRWVSALYLGYLVHRELGINPLELLRPRPSDLDRGLEIVRRGTRLIARKIT